LEKQACAQTEAGSGHDHGLCAFRPGVSFPSSLHKLQVKLFLIYRVQFWIAKKKEQQQQHGIVVMESCFCLEDEREGRTRELWRSFPPEVSALPATKNQTLVVKTTTTASHQRLVCGYKKPDQYPGVS
jgi:hypothetical protein